MKICLNKVTLAIVNMILFLGFFNVFVSFGANCTKDYYHLNVSGNANGFIEFARISCDGHPARLWFTGYSVPGQGGYEAILPGRLPPLKYFPPQVGDTWEAQDSEILLDGTVYPTILEGTVTSLSETVSVAAGTFTNCAKVEETILYPKGIPAGYGYWPIKTERWFAPGVGPVKLLITSLNGVPYPGELISYADITADPGDYFPLGLNYTWTFKMSDGSSATWTVDDYQSQAEYGLVSPSKGDFIPAGSGYSVIWGVPPEVTYVKLKYSLDNGVTWKLLSDNESGPNYSWDVPSVNGNKPNGLLKLIGYNGSGGKVGSDTSGPFTIEVVRLTFPNGGEPPFSSGQKITVTWNTYGTIDTVTQVQLSYSLDNGITWKNFSDQPPPGSNPGSFQVTLPTVTKAKSKCKVKAVLKDINGKKLGADTSNWRFTILP